MADAYAAPSGPPPPQVPEGWKAVFDARYNEWFYVNLYTKKSQWDKPTRPAEPDHDHAPPDVPPPSYSENATSNTPGTALAGENPKVNVVNGGVTGSSNPIPIAGPATTSNRPGESPLPTRPGAETEQAQDGRHTGSRLAKGLMKKLLGKGSHQYSNQMYPQGYTAFQQGHHSYPPRRGFLYGGPGGMAAIAGPGTGYYGGHGMIPGQRPHRGAGGMAGPAALGLGGGLLGGTLLGSAMHGGHHGGYGYGPGMGLHGGYGGYGGGGDGYGSGSGSDGAGGSDAGDYGDGAGGGDDFGGGDFDGGDFGGGDFGGGDF